MGEGPRGECPRVNAHGRMPWANAPWAVKQEDRTSSSPVLAFSPSFQPDNGATPLFRPDRAQPESGRSTQKTRASGQLSRESSAVR